MHLFRTDQGLLREIADGLSSVEGGKVDGVLALMGAGLVTGERISSAGSLAFRNVMLTHRGQAYLYPAEGPPKRS